MRELINMQTASQQGLANCQICGKLSDAKLIHCPRCESNLYLRKPDSIHRVLAYLVTACILYIPANVLPVTKTLQLGTHTESTIIGGVLQLWEHGSYPVAIIIFVASIIIPILKILIMFWLCWCVSANQLHRPKERTLIYRITEFTGRWSMIDVFVVAILVALIQLGGILTIKPGLGILAFAAVVMVTMFAAFAFDPRLIWDRVPQNTSANE